MKKNILYLGFIGFRNVGDEVCHDAFAQRLAQMPEYQAVPYDAREKPSIPEIHRRTPLRGVILGGGSLLQGTAFIQPAFEAASMGLPMWTFGTGVDFFTEEYTQKLINGDPAGPPQMFEDKPLEAEKITKIIKHSRYVGVRGPVTRRFLGQLFSADKIRIIGDSGLLYVPGRDDALLQHRPGERFVAVNWGSSFGSIFGHDEARTMAALTDGLRCLTKLGYGVLIYPMWEGDMDACRRLHEAVGQPDKCRLVTFVGTVDGICRMLREAVFSIGFKLHASVLSARMGTPFIALAYRSKCIDFAHSVGMSGQCIPTSSPDIAGFIVRQEAAIAQGRDEMRRAMAEYRELYRDMHEQLWQSITKTI